ncbi:MAG: SurA N-terminal domain-containing protein [Pseudonocardiaceae bacterium]
MASRAVVGVLAVAALIGGCGTAGVTQAGTAAFVGDTVISTEQVQDQLRTVLDKEGAQLRAELVTGRQLDDLSRQIVTLLVRHELIKVAAEREGLSVTPAQVSKLLYDLGGPEEASKGTIWDAEGFREQARDQLLMAQLGRKVLRTAVTFDYTTAGTRADAIERAEGLAAAGPQRARELIKADVEAKRDAVVSERVVAGDDPIFAASPAFGVPKDTVVAFQLADTQPWLITVVKNRTDGAEPSDLAPDPDQLDPALLEAIGLRQLAPVAQDLGLRINPRYGVWDQVNLKAVPDESEIGGFVGPLGAVPPA